MPTHIKKRRYSRRVIYVNERKSLQFSNLPYGNGAADFISY